MQNIPSGEVNRFSDSQKFPHIVWNPKVQYHTHKSPPPVPILIQISPVHASPSSFTKIHFIIILLSPPQYKIFFQEVYSYDDVFILVPC